MQLTTAPNLPDPDATYAALIAAHDGLTETESQALNARLILILVNQIGDPAVIDDALTLARNAAQSRPED